MSNGYSAPSEKRLIEAFKISKETAQKIRAVIKGGILPEDILHKARYYPPHFNLLSFQERVMLALDVLLEGYGAEWLDGRYVRRYWQNCQLLYVNMGDPYLATLAYDTEKDRFLLTSWGDFVERNRRRFPEN